MTAELEIVGSSRLLAGVPADIEVRLYRDGILTSPTGTLTFTVVDADGNSIASGTPTLPEVGVLTAALTAAQLADVNLLTVTWGGIVFGSEPAISLTTQHEVVGDFLFSLQAARAFDPPDGNPNEGALSNAQRYPDVMLLDARDAITDRFEDILGYPLGRRYRREILDGDGCDTLYVNEHRGVATVRAAATRVAQTWTALTADELADVAVTVSGRLVRETLGVWPSGVQNVRVSYECASGRIHPDLRRAGLLLLRKTVVGSNIDASMTQMVSEMGTYVYSQPGLKGSFVGLPEVDEILSRHRVKLPVFA